MAVVDLFAKQIHEDGTATTNAQFARWLCVSCNLPLQSNKDN